MLISNTLKTLVKIIVVFQIGFVFNQNIKGQPDQPQGSTVAPR